MRTRPLLAIAAAAAITLSACSAGGDATDDAAPQAADGAFPVTIAHAFGETVIESQPEAVATVGWSNQEAAIALGVVPVIMEEATWGDDDGDGVLPWVEEALADLDAETPAMYDGTEGVDFEAIADADPDVILAAYSGISQDDYDTLSQIAPVVAYPDVAWGTSWQDMTVLNGTALGMQDEAEALVADLETQIADAAAGLEGIDGTSAAFAFLDVNDLSSVGYYIGSDPRVRFLGEVGFDIPEVITSGDQTEFYQTISAEQVDELSDFDVIVTYGSADDLATLQADPLISRIPAVANGAVVFLDDSTPEGAAVAASANPSPLGIAFTIERYLPLLGDAAAAAS